MFTCIFYLDSLKFWQKLVFVWPSNWEQISTNNSLVEFLEVHSAATAHMHMQFVANVL